MKVKEKRWRMTNLKIEHSEEERAAYLYIQSEKKVNSTRQFKNILIDFDVEGEIVGVEFLDVEKIEVTQLGEGKD